MKRIPLPPARTVTESAAVGDLLPQRPLGPAQTAEERPRHLFHPRRGWIRLAERETSHLLSRHVYPWVPGARRPYSRALVRGLTLSEGTVELAGLPAAFEGLRLLLVTDVHAGPFLEAAALKRTFERLAALAPDAVLLGGDLATSRVAEFLETREAYAALRTPLGTYAVLGNHDHYTGEPAILRAALEAAGIAVLHNRSVVLERGGAALTLAGIDDWLVGAPDLDRALEGARGPVVLLSHHPDVFFEAARRGVALVLSGHTHGGQVRVPGLPVLVRMSRFRLDEGRYRAGSSELVVSRGLGVVGLPLRLACPPEAVLLELRRQGSRTPTSG
ncbi:MAG TPA: metallophosphoesterase [Candidatus Polarisedimenticolaceae bacterium]|nr:metallophosphoesterase [Candidatus Polarisedimenticolaceae bacterium]